MDGETRNFGAVIRIVDGLQGDHCRVFVTKVKEQRREVSKVFYSHY